MRASVQDRALPPGEYAMVLSRARRVRGGGVRITCTLPTAAGRRRLAWDVQVQRRVRRAGADNGIAMASAATADALIHDLFGPPDAVAVPRPRVRAGEHRIARQLIEDAMKDAVAPVGPPRRRAQVKADARAWLRNAAALLSARYCFEALDIDYEAALKKLEVAWLAADAAARRGKA